MAKFGREWLGIDTEGQLIEAAHSPYIESPRRYGFHATLKAPMRLADGVNFNDFHYGVKKLASQLTSAELGILKLHQIGHFLALKTDDAYHEAVCNIAWHCTKELDGFRAPLTNKERAKRKNLNKAESENLEQWGYPYVNESFRFHMTLTSSLSHDALIAAMQILSTIVPDETARLDSIAIFGDPGSLKPFEFVERFDLKEQAVTE